MTFCADDLSAGTKNIGKGFIYFHKCKNGLAKGSLKGLRKFLLTLKISEVLNENYDMSIDIDQMFYVKQISGIK